MLVNMIAPAEFLVSASPSLLLPSTAMSGGRGLDAMFFSSAWSLFFPQSMQCFLPHLAWCSRIWSAMAVLLPRSSLKVDSILFHLVDWSGHVSRF